MKNSYSLLVLLGAPWYRPKKDYLETAMKRREMTLAIAAALMMPFARAQVTPATPASGGKQLRIVPTIAPVAGTVAPAERDMQAYLFVYFKDETHAIHFATSTDGYTFTDINDGQPVLPGISKGAAPMNWCSISPPCPPPCPSKRACRA